MNNQRYLKIKRSTLVFESIHIRKQERKAYIHFRSNLDYAYPDMQQQIPEDQEDWPKEATESLWHYNTLRNHRTGIVRQATRSTNLAIAYIQGKRYDQVEEPNSTPFDVKEVARLVHKYGRDNEIILGAASAIDLKSMVSTIEKWVESSREIKEAAE